jgi:pyridoxamine-phosphate oxidase
MTDSGARAASLTGDATLHLPEFDAPPPDPVALLRAWFDGAEEAVREPLAATLATSSPETGPSSRTILVKGLEADGTVLVTTSYLSRKAVEMDATRRAALTFHWRETLQQVNVVGSAERVDDATAGSLFDRRPIGARAASAVSAPGHPLDDEAEMAARAAALVAGGEVRRPATWGGYRITPERIEFWHGRPTRLHRRLSYRRHEGVWTWTRLQP